MNLNDLIGKRGEDLFRVMISKWCDGKPWFEAMFQGDKAEPADFLVRLHWTTSGDATFYVQVKATRRGYSGKGDRRKLRVSVSRKDVKKLQALRVPVYVVGIDIDEEVGFVMAVPRVVTKGLSGVPVTYPINCETIRMLWDEVEAYTNARPTVSEHSRFIEVTP
jgi:hypothetical protein